MTILKNFSQNLIIILIALFSVVPAFGAGEVDTSFNSYLGKLGVGRVWRSVIQTDGKIIISGNFSMVNGIPKSTITRLNADGTPDTSFNVPPISSAAANPAIETIGVQSNGKIIIGGSFQQFSQGVVRPAIARLNTDGSLDMAFNSSPALNGLFVVYDLKITSDDKIIFAGVKGGVNVLTRLNADGSLDAETTFSGFVYRLALAPDGKIVVSSGSVRRLNQDLTLDNTFAPVNMNNTAYSIIVQPDGKTLIQGIFSQINGTNSPRLVRVNTDGTVDVPFVLNAFTGNNGTYALALMPNGKILTGYSLRNPDGTLDNSFSAITGPSTLFDLNVQPDGKIIASGELPTGSSDAQSLVARYNSNGQPDTSFQGAVGGFGYGRKIIVQPDNKILVSGDFNYSGGRIRRSPTRLNADGSIDTTFNTSINYGLGDIFPNGKIVAVSGVTVYRLNSDGSQDIAFPDAISNINDIKALPNGKVLISTLTNLFRYNSDGTLDSSFFAFGNASIYKILPLPDGKILIGGNFTQVNGIDRSRIARLNADGTLDTTFNSPAGGINGAITNIVLTPDGKFLINGTFSGISFNSRPGLARLNADAGLDLGFVPPSSYSVDDIKVQTDGKVLLGEVNRCQRLNANGTPDTTFNCTPSVGNSDSPRIRGIGLQSDGKIIVAGDFLRINGVLAPGIARLRSTSKVLFDYDGDGRADVSVFRPTENKWYIFQSSDGQIVQRVFAVAGDLPTPADFDGDGRTDVSVFRPTFGDWWSLSSNNGNQIFAHWGANGDIPRPADFDGDGRADYIVFRATENNWYRISSATGIASNRSFGLAGDKPVSGDFDGDGKADVAIYRPNTGQWWYQSSIDNSQRATQFGIASDTPVAADYDGDGKTDLAVYRSQAGVWYILNSSNGSFTVVPFGLPEDKPVPADYDGDGRVDIAVYRPSTGIWYQLRSTTGFSAIQFGNSTDIPTPNAFVP